MIYSVTVHLGKPVHVQAMGITSQLMLFAWGSDPDEAAGAAMAYCTGLDLDPVRAERARIAVQQEVGRYTFPEQIVALPDAMAREAITKAGYPEEMASETLRQLEKRQHALSRGLTQTHVALAHGGGA